MTDDLDQELLGVMYDESRTYSQRLEAGRLWLAVADPAGPLRDEHRANVAELWLGFGDWSGTVAPPIAPPAGWGRA